jgi:hypothetical protein
MLCRERFAARAMGPVALLRRFVIRDMWPVWREGRQKIRQGMGAVQRLQWCWRQEQDLDYFDNCRTCGGSGWA